MQIEGYRYERRCKPERRRQFVGYTRRWWVPSWLWRLVAEVSVEDARLLAALGALQERDRWAREAGL